VDAGPQQVVVRDVRPRKVSETQQIGVSFERYSHHKGLLNGYRHGRIVRGGRIRERAPGVGQMKPTKRRG
jgi:hypothetical protein